MRVCEFRWNTVWFSAALPYSTYTRSLVDPCFSDSLGSGNGVVVTFQVGFFIRSDLQYINCWDSPPKSILGFNVMLKGVVGYLIGYLSSFSLHPFMCLKSFWLDIYKANVISIH